MTITEVATARILIADDQNLFRSGLARLLEADPRVKVIGQAVDGLEVIKKVGSLKPDVILMDLKMPGLNGQQIYERLKDSNPRVSERMIFITGDVVNQKTQAFLEKSKKVCLAKPFSLGEFREAVARASK